MPSAERLGLTLEDLLQAEAWVPARALAEGRLVGAVEDATRVDSSIRAPAVEVAAHAYERLLVSVLNDGWVARRHALAVALRTKARLDEDADPGALAAVGRALGVAFESDGDAVRVPLVAYVQVATHLRDVEWKLVRQHVDRGVVRIERTQAARLVQEALRRRTEAELPRSVDDADVRRAVEPLLARVREVVARRHVENPTKLQGPVEVALMPPCMRHLLGELQRGANVPHTGRFAVVTFLRKAGMSIEDMMALFAQAPDFRADLTKYQVDHITGMSSATTYSPPSCGTMRTWNHCVGADNVCRDRKRDGAPRVTHPFDYYDFQRWWKGRFGAPKRTGTEVPAPEEGTTQPVRG